MEEAVPEDHRHPGVREGMRDVATLVRPQRLHVEIRDLRAAKELERQDPRRRVLPDDLRHDDALVAHEVAVEYLRVPRLVAVVELEADGARELVHELSRVHELERLDALAQELRRLVEQAEVGLDLLRGGRALHLDRDLAAVRQHGAVHLSDRRRRERREVELEECAIHAQIELRLDDVAHLLERDRRRVILEAAELGDDVRRDDVGTRREELPELDERRPELVEHRAQALAAVGGGRGVPVRVAGDEVAEPVPAEEVAEAVACRHLCDLGQTPEVPRRPILGRRHRLIVGPPGGGLGVVAPLEELHAMLELRDAQREVANRLTRSRTELGCRARRVRSAASRRGGSPRGASCRADRR